MDWKSLLGGAALAALKPVVVAILAIVGIILLIIPLIIIWQYGFLTGLIWGLLTLLFVFVLHRAELIDTKECPWIIFIPFVAFGLGVIVEKFRLFPALQVQPLFASSSDISLMSLFFEISNVNVSLSEILMLISVILLVIGLVVKRT